MKRSSWLTDQRGIPYILKHDREKLFAEILSATFFPSNRTGLAAGGETVYGTRSIVFWTGSWVFKWGGHRRPSAGERWLRSWKGDSRCLCLCCLGGRREKFKKCATKMANTLISLFAKGAVKLSPPTPRFPSRLIKEEIAPEEAAMTKGLLIVQRPLYRVHILHTTFPKCLHQTHCPGTRWVPRVTVNQGCRGNWCSGYGMEAWKHKFC